MYKTVHQQGGSKVIYLPADFVKNLPRDDVRIELNGDITFPAQLTHHLFYALLIRRP